MNKNMRPMIHIFYVKNEASWVSDEQKCEPDGWNFLTPVYILFI
jgi:hypothetical protein